MVDIDNGKRLAPFQCGTYDKKNVVTDNLFNEFEQTGFHVFATRETGRRYLKHRNIASRKIEKVIVKGFKASGVFYSIWGSYKSEIWQEMEFVN